MKTVYMTIGLIGSGKSTWAKTKNWPIVNPDSIRLALHGNNYIQSAEPTVWAIAYTMVNALFLAGHAVVIVDATNVTEKRRKDWRYNISENIKIEYEIFYTSKDTCIKRAKFTNREDLIPIIEKMDADWETPNV